MTNMPLHKAEPTATSAYALEETARTKRENPGPSGPGGFNKAPA